MKISAALWLLIALVALSTKLGTHTSRTSKAKADQLLLLGFSLISISLIYAEIYGIYMQIIAEIKPIAIKEQFFSNNTIRITKRFSAK